MVNQKRVEAEAALLPGLAGGLQSLRARITTVESLENEFDWLVRELQRVAAAGAPQRKPNRGFQSPWWTPEVKEARKTAKRAEREHKRIPTAYLHYRLGQAQRSLSRAIQQAKTKAWRSTLQEATQQPELLWKLERWARLRSFTPPDPPKHPALADPLGGPDLATFGAKARALAGKFFPRPPADLSDIQDPDLQQDWVPDLPLQQDVTSEDIAEALANARPWKAPGEDNLPTGFLKLCGPPLYDLLAALATACLRLGWFPDRFKRAKTVVLQKPGKLPTAYRTVGGYRPIALLPTLGKVIEAVVARRITGAAEAYGLLPDEQMGNRAHRSTELAVRLVVAQVQEAWRQKTSASLLQLDIAGAFDTVNHTRLLATLRDFGFPRWLVVWLRAWLSGRVAILCFDGQSTEDISVKARVP